MMNGSILEWMWRVDLLDALWLIACELHVLHKDLNLPVADQATVASTQDDRMRRWKALMPSAMTSRALRKT